LWRYSEVLKWLSENRTESGAEPDERALRNRKLAAEVRRAELLAGKLDGTLVDRHGDESFLFENARLCRDNILSIPARISGLLLNLSDQGDLARKLGPPAGPLTPEAMRLAEVSRCEPQT
jgi:hypothetical protein